jgi:hypothetical protein
MYSGVTSDLQRCRTKDATELRDRMTHDYLCDILRGVQRKADATVQFPGAYLSAAEVPEAGSHVCLVG